MKDCVQVETDVLNKLAATQREAAVAHIIQCFAFAARVDLAQTEWFTFLYSDLNYKPNWETFLEEMERV